MSEEIRWQVLSLVIGVALIGFGAKSCEQTESGGIVVCTDHCFPMRSQIVGDRCECLMRGGQ
jgi:hypothetical protein